MNQETYEALKRVMGFTREVFTNDVVSISKKDIEQVETWIDEVAKEYEGKAMDYFHKRAEKANDVNLREE